MAVPKKRTSVSRKGKRHAGHTHKLHARLTIKCPNCSAAVIPHHVCPSCGTYKGKEYIALKVKKEETDADSAT